MSLILFTFKELAEPSKKLADQKRDEAERDTDDQTDDKDGCVKSWGLPSAWAKMRNKSRVHEWKTWTIFMSMSKNDDAQ